MRFPNENDQIPSVNQTSFAGGMRDRDHASLLNPDQYALSKNIEIRDAGLAKMRSGRTIKTDTLGAYPQGGIFFKDNSGNEYIVQCNAGKTYYWTGTGTTWTQIGTTTFTNTTTNVSMSILNGRLFIAPGTSDNNYSWTGSGSLTDEGNTNADPPRGTLLCQQSGRLVSGGEAASNQDYNRFSDIFDGQTWDRNANNKRTPTDGSEAITAIAAYRKEEVLVFTAFSSHSWNVSGSSVSAFARTQIHSKVGCVASKSLTVIGDDAYFLSTDKHVHSVKRNYQDAAYGVTVPVSYYVPNLMGRINSTYINLCAGVYFNNYYLLAAPLDTSTTNSAVIVFDMLHQYQTPSGLAPVCVGEWTNIAANQFVVAYFSGVARLYYIDAVNGSLKLMFDGSGTDDGTTITATTYFRSFDFGSPNHLKIARDGELQFTNSSGTATLTYVKDDAVENSIGSTTIGGSGASLPVSLPFTLPGDSGINPWIFPMYKTGVSKYWQLRLTFAGSSMSLKQTTMRASTRNFVSR